ncbi:Nif11-like leader peptide family natural product precursor [Synechococcus sp. CS-197]|nr:Nif11-like leader peptide family natural product precursor [Synechococcus sp. CS-197]
MSEEDLKVFLEAVKADAGLQEKMKAAAEPSRGSDCPGCGLCGNR